MGWLKKQNLNILRTGHNFSTKYKILNLCFRWHILRSCFVMEVTFNDLLGSTCFYFKSKVIELSHKGENVFFFLILEHYSKCAFLRLWHFFSGYPINSIFQWWYLFIGLMFLMKHYSSRLSECLWSTNFLRWWHTARSTLP